MNLYDQVRLTALYYSLSGRVAGRLDELLWARKSKKSKIFKKI